MNLINQSIKKILKKFILQLLVAFLKYSLNKMKNIKPSEAINHLNGKWEKKYQLIQLLMNKIFEVIEANKLFSIDINKIDILIHPQSLVHAIIKFKNGLYKFLYFETDMSIPIGNALLKKILR